MMSRPVQRLLVLTALALATPVLAGCGIEAKDETSKEHAEIQAASNHIVGIRIRNAFITPATGTTATAAAGSARSYLVVTLVNNGRHADQLTGISTSLGTATLNTHGDGAGASSGVDLPHGVLVRIATPEMDPDAPTLEITGMPAVVGTTALVSFTFANAGTTQQIAVPVVSPGRNFSPTQAVPTDQATFSTPIE